MNYALKHSGLVLVAAGLSLVVFSAAADARTPSTSSNVTSITATLPSFYEHPEPDNNTLYVGIDECQSLVENDSLYEVTFQTASTINLLFGDETFSGIYRYALNEGETQSVSCEDSERCELIDRDDYEYPEGSSTEVSVEIPFRELADISTVAGCDEPVLQNIYTQIQVRQDPTTTVVTEWSYAEHRIRFDLQRPEVPTLVDSFATPNSVRIEYEESSSDDVRRHFVVVSPTELTEGMIPDAEGLSPRPLEGLGDTEEATNFNLEAGSEVFIAITARDESGNYSPISNVQTVTVTPTQNFWDFYREAGGTEEGGFGCSSTKQSTPPTGFLLLASLLGLVALRRRSRPTNLMLGLLTVSALTLLIAPSAMAQESANPFTRGVIEVKMGPYMPMVDDEFGGDGPYNEFFAGSSMLNGEVATDFHLWQGFGKLSAGAHLGYGRVKGRLRLDDGSQLEGSDRSTFSIIPLRASLIYRYDYSALNHGIPLVPVAKAGLDYYFWRVTTPGGDTAEADGTTAIGGRAGWHATLGLHLHLNFLDRSSAAAFNLNWGIKNSYLFGEYTWSRIDGFGSEGINLSANHWSAGLAFEF